MPGMGNIPASDYNCVYHGMPSLLLPGHGTGQIAFALVPQLRPVQFIPLFPGQLHIDARAYVPQPLGIGGADKGLYLRRMARLVMKLIRA